MKKISIIIVAFLCVCLLGGCKTNSSMGRTPKYDLSAYTSEYTNCIQNKDGTFSFYIYSSPVNCSIDGKLYAINNSIKKSNTNYAYENHTNDIKTYFPANLSSNICILKDNEKIEVGIKYGTA